MSTRPRALFFGTPEFAVPCLNALVEVADVAGVICQPDKPVGRGLTLTPPPVKTRALALGMAVHQPTKLKTGEFAEWVRTQNADVALVVAYGRILPEAVLTAPRLGCVNVHASLLPKYRGAAPIQWAIVRGEPKTGITLMKMDAGMDTGEILATWGTDIGPDETAGELSARLSELGGNVVREGIPTYLRGDYVARPQDHAQATLAPLLQKTDGKIDWSRAAEEIHNRVRGMNPWPGGFTSLKGKTVKIHRTKIVDPSSTRASPGTVIVGDKTRVLVQCGRGTIDLETIQLEGKKAMRAVEVVLGRGIAEGDVFA